MKIMITMAERMNFQFSKSSQHLPTQQRCQLYQSEILQATDPGAGGEQGWEVETPFNVYMMHKWDVAGGLEKI